MLDYHAVRNRGPEESVHRYAERETMLYALGIGMGADPGDAGQLSFVYERNLQVVPTMAAALGHPGPMWREPQIGADWARVVHGEEDLRLLKPLPARGAIRVRNSVVSLTDKGPAKGALAATLRELVDEASGELIARGRSVAFLRGDGGFSRTGGTSDPPPEPLAPVPGRAADAEVTLASLPQAGLIYRLFGDDNPLHADPDAARAAGFPRPILHGLCTYGMAAHALLRCCCGYDASRLCRIAARFAAAVYPGDILRFELWRETGMTVHFRAQVDARGVVVLDRGVAEIR
jgi:acyl dehydratase